MMLVSLAILLAFSVGLTAGILSAVHQNSWIDYVVTFAERDVNRLLELVKPDLHCKGTDYTADTVPERDTVLSYGGRVAIVGDPKDHSTHDLIPRIKHS